MSLGASRLGPRKSLQTMISAISNRTMTEMAQLGEPFPGILFSLTTHTPLIKGVEFHPLN